jgi:DNA-binding NtrC family response regulator
VATRPTEARVTKPALLLVDDDVLITDTLAFALGADFEVLACESRAHAIDLLRQLAAPPPLALVDLGLPPRPHTPDEGFLLIADLLAHSPGMRIFVLTGQSDAAHARHARALGAVEFIAKPCNPASLKAMLSRALEVGGEDDLEPAQPAERLLGGSEAIARLRNQIAQSADSPFSVLIEGESGSGKERVALALHRSSQRAARPYLALNCAAIAPTLVEPTLFGYVKGAFTGATSNKSGYFEDAQDGTLFLDEIGELPFEMQAKLLRVLENGEYQRVGETQRRVARARVVAATNRDLRQETRQGRFRTDLYHRLSVLTLAVPPLRDMGRDRLLLLEHYREQFAAQAGAAPFTLDAQAERAWLEYRFPGNVRELRNIVIRLTTKHAGRRLTPAELEPEFDLQPAVAATPPTPDLQAEAQRELERGGFQLDATLKAWERAYVDAALKLTRGNVSQAAKLLGVNRTTLYSRMSLNEEKEP